MPENLHIDLHLNKDDLPPVSPLDGDEEEKLEPEEIIAERTKIRHSKMKKYRNTIKILDSKQIIN